MLQESSIAIRIVCWILLSSLCWAQQPGIATQVTKSTPTKKPAAKSALDKALDAKIELDFEGAPLTEVIQYLRDELEINIHLDESGLDDSGIDQDTPININLKSVSLRTALRLMLRNHGLSFYKTRGDEVLVITSIEEAEINLEVEVYSIQQLINLKDPHASADSLIHTIIESVATDSWDDVGGPASITYYQGNLICKQTADGHAALVELLEKLRVQIQAAGGAVLREAGSYQPGTKNSGRMGGGGMF